MDISFINHSCPDKAFLGTDIHLFIYKLSLQLHFLKFPLKLINRLKLHFSISVILAISWWCMQTFHQLSIFFRSNSQSFNIVNLSLVFHSNIIISHSILIKDSLGLNVSDTGDLNNQGNINIYISLYHIIFPAHPGRLDQ